MRCIGVTATAAIANIANRECIVVRRGRSATRTRICGCVPVLHHRTPHHAPRNTHTHARYSRTIHMSVRACKFHTVHSVQSSPTRIDMHRTWIHVCVWSFAQRVQGWSRKVRVRYCMGVVAYGTTPTEQPKHALAVPHNPYAQCTAMYMSHMSYRT